MKDFLNKLYPVGEEILDEYLSYWKPVEYKRKQIITRAGQTERFLYYVEEGVQRSYYIKEGKEYVMAFTYPPSFTGIPESFLTQFPSKYYLECITHSKLMKINYEDHQKMLLKLREIETMTRKATELILVGFLERHFELLSYSIEERFIAFVRRSPHLLNMVPHKHLASYLGIDPTNFSKLLHTHRI